MKMIQLSIRGAMLRRYLPQVIRDWSNARVKMRAWALQWKLEVQTRGRSEVSDALLDLAVGWRSVAAGPGNDFEFARPVGRAVRGPERPGAGGRSKQAPSGVPVLAGG